MNLDFIRNLNRVVHCRGDVYKGFKAPKCKKTYGTRWMITITVNKHGFIKDVSAPDLLEINARPSRAQIEETRTLNLQILNGFLGDIEVKRSHIGSVGSLILSFLNENREGSIKELTEKCSLTDTQVYYSCQKLYKKGLIKRTYKPILVYYL